MFTNDFQLRNAFARTNLSHVGISDRFEASFQRRSEMNHVQIKNEQTTIRKYHTSYIEHNFFLQFLNKNRINDAVTRCPLTAIVHDIVCFLFFG